MKTGWNATTFKDLCTFIHGIHKNMEEASKDLKYAVKFAQFTSDGNLKFHSGLRNGY